jgi:hypothetical protein
LAAEDVAESGLISRFRLSAGLMMQSVMDVMN